MKKVLSLLVVFVFLQVQTWALSGGPFGSSSSSAVVGVTGTYAAVLIGTIPVGGGGAPAGAGLGILTVGLPDGGIGTGIFAIFSGGATIGGDVIGLADLKNQSIKGVMTGTFIPNVSFTGGVIFGGAVTQLGAQFDAKVRGGRSGAGATLTGTAAATITYFTFPNTQVTTNFTLTGYKQSNDPTLATSVTLPGGFSGKGGGGG